MIKKLKLLFFRLKKALIDSENNNCFYNSSIKTSCAVPAFKKETKVWRITIFCFDTFEVEYYWVDNESDLDNTIDFLNSIGCSYETKQYDLKFNI